MPDHYIAYLLARIAERDRAIAERDDEITRLRGLLGEP